MTVSMTWPEYLVGCCRLDGRLTRLRMQAAHLLCVLLLGHPDVALSMAELIERMWPDADEQPDWGAKIVQMMVPVLRGHGIVIEGRYGFGYRIPREARGQEQMRLAA